MIPEQKTKYRQLAFYRHETRLHQRATNGNVGLSLISGGLFLTAVNYRQTWLSLLMLSGVALYGGRTFRSYRLMKRAQYRANRLSDQLKTWTR